MKFLVVFAATLVGLVASAVLQQSTVRYDGYKAYTITPKTMEEAQLLFNLHDNNEYDFWTEPRTLNKPFTVMVTPKAQETFEETLTQHGIEWRVLINNVQDTIDAEDRERLMSSATKAGVSFNQYMSHREINEYLITLALMYPDIVQLEDFGRSYEGRDMLLVRITSGGFGKPTIFVDAGIHAREWIAPPTALYIIHQLVENPENAHLYQNVDWAIIPVLNPDGYEFTQTNNRLWRKTRTLGPSGNCYGTDPNRNFDFHWMVNGASNDECTEIYAGPHAFSEIECRNLRDYLLTHRDNIKLYLTFHSYGNYVLFPWGFTEETSDDYDELQALGNSVNDAIYGFSGTNYTVGMTTHVLYAAAGGSDDWAKGVAGIDLAYTIEMPAGGLTGFNPPAQRILPIVREMFEGIKAYHNYIEVKYATKREN